MDDQNTKKLLTKETDVDDVNLNEKEDSTNLNEFEDDFKGYTRRSKLLLFLFFNYKKWMTKIQRNY